MTAATRLTVLLLALVVSAPFAGAADRLVVHEWGTFTSLQDETGRALSHINTDDEPVPRFVYGVSKSQVLIAPTEMPPPLSQGAPSGHPDVTMRLETPVTYFHLPAGVKQMTLDVSAEFHGGWLTEFFPKAKSLADGKPFPLDAFPRLTEQTVGRLTWKNVRLGGEGKGPATNDPVWLSPRKVDAANVTVDDTSERFLFYRGVAHLDAPLHVTQDGDKQMLRVTGEFPRPTPGHGRPPALWLLDVRPDGRCAFRAVNSIDARSNAVHAASLMTFADNEYASDSSALRAEMRAALIKEGLFADEADALLATWELSYFKAPGTRLFFTVPQTWTDQVLPLKLSEPADVTRVMVGRIELITPRQRALLKTIAAGPVPNLKEVVTAMSTLQRDQTRRDAYNALASGRGDVKALAVPVPAIYQAYLELGRFRTAMVLDACQSADVALREMLNDFAFEVQMPGLGIPQQRAKQRAAAQ